MAKKVFGIDLGTTYSCIAFVNDYGQPQVVPNKEGELITPSVVAFEEGGHYSAGNAAKETLASDPQNVVSTIKREMGKRDFSCNFFGTNWNPEEISALILKKLAEDASIQLGEEVKDVVITCPAYFGLEEKEATKNAGEIAKLNVLGILNEPTAAAISYGLKVDSPQTVMVYDLGGGTFDITIIKVENSRIRVVATGGDHKLGGKDWDNIIRDYVVQKYCEQTGEQSDAIYDDSELMGELELNAETAKKHLTEKPKTIVKLKGEKIEITRELFNQMTAGKLESTIKYTQFTMAEAAKKGVSQYDKILLVGGSTYMPQVKERLMQEFPNIPIEYCEPNQSVAKGAAIYGLNKAAFGDIDIDDPDRGEIRDNPIFQPGLGGVSKPIDVRDVISHSIAVRLVLEDNHKHIVNQIFKQTEIPCDHVLHAGTQDDNQNTVLIEIFVNNSDESEVPEGECRELVSGEMGPLPVGLPAGSPIDLVFKIDANGLLSIDAAHKPSGVTKHLEMNLKNSLTKEKIQEGMDKVGGLRQSS